MEKLEPNLVGVTGEYYVAAELSRRGNIASITLRNSRGIDIVASSADASRSITIQVKTNSDGSSNWVLNKKSEEFYSDSHFYVFVSLPTSIGSSPSFHVVPSETVAQTITINHQNWLSGTKRDGSPRTDSPMRKFRDPKDEFKDKWDSLWR